MAKIQPTAKTRKLTADGFSICSASSQKKYPELTEVLRDENEVKELNLFLSYVKKSRRVQMLENHLAASLLAPQSFEEMKAAVLPCRTDDAASRCRDAVHPAGTMEWTFEVFPELRAHVCEFLLAADEMEDMVRDLTAGYNYVGTDSEDLNDILTRSNHLCKKLALFSKVNQQRLRVMAKLGRTNTTREITQEKDKQAA